MISFDEALSIIIRHIKELSTPEIEVPLIEAVNHLLAEDIYTDTPLPNFTNSSMDGFAVKYHAGISNWRITGEISAGNFGEFPPLDNDSAIRIMTGGKLPPGADTIIPVEEVLENEGTIYLREGISLTKWQYVRKEGDDIAPGEIVISEGTFLGSQHIAMAAACGKSFLRVQRKIKAGILTTGDELVDITEIPSGDKVRGTNLYALLVLAGQNNMDAVNLGISGDDTNDIQQKISSALNSDIDILITTGGVSVGKYDFIEEMFEKLGAEIFFNQVNIKPGKPVVFAKYRKKLIFGLPGNPVSSFVSFIIFIRRALEIKYGNNMVPLIYAELLENIKKEDNKRHFIRAVVFFDHIHMKYLVSKKTPQSSGNIVGLSSSNCLIIFPEDKHELPAGEQVKCILI
jgi:molybdopterin molybdotransferase